MNPVNLEFLELSGIEAEDVSQVVCEYEKGRGYVKISLYSSQEGAGTSSYIKDIKELSLDKFCDSYSSITGQVLSFGVEKEDIYDFRNHRKIIYLRIFLPAGKVQIDYEDESINIDMSSSIENYLRSKFSIIR